MIEEVKSFEIIIVNKYFGRDKNITTVNQDSIIIEQNVNVGKNYLKESHLVSEEQKSELLNFLQDFPINDFKEAYYNKNVKDGTQLVFSIKINSKEIDIELANYYIKELGELVVIIDKILPKDYSIYYSKESCPTEIKR